MFRRVLIANRGEIALRIRRGCEKLGVEPVMVYSESDRSAPWLADARSICVGPGRADASYLDARAILQAAEQTDCQAIHPGYGFLSENATFAARCAQQGITFIGPPASAIQRMGAKAQAKRTMAEAGLPTIPGSDGTVQTLEEVREVVSRIGFPLLLKASAGGGGKGMRRCEREEDLAAAFSEARLEAEKAFGDPALYVEKLLSGGRHIEFQVLCDAFGSAVHLGERECSIQRKHQKLVEESPSPVVDRSTRESLGRRVATAAARLGYRSAGTVEFLRDRDGKFYFMEMNTRLQVEHPVTEMVSGIDLVEWQLRIGANQPLTLRQDELAPEGHAVEFRINAEDPSAGFRPDPGTIDRFTAPPATSGGVSVRWDSAVEEGYRIPPYYDSMIGKLILHGKSRSEVLAAADEVLERIVIEGVRTTIPFHRALLAAEPFASGNYDIDTLTHSGLLDEPGPRSR